MLNKELISTSLLHTKEKLETHSLPTVVESTFLSDWNDIFHELKFSFSFVQQNFKFPLINLLITWASSIVFGSKIDILLHNFKQMLYRLTTLELNTILNL